MRHCLHTYLGRVPYRDGVELQERCARSVKDGSSTDYLLLLEHPPVITLGRNARDDDVLLGPTALRARGFTVERTNRGGQVTYHGPGQLVGYPIINLNPDRRDIGRYLRDLEELLIRTLDRFGITADRRMGLTGVWVGEVKIAAIGVHLSRWVTTHGFALNVTTDLSHFGLIVPCGLRGPGVTSMERILRRGVPLEDVAREIASLFGAVFGRTMIETELPAAPGAAAGGIG